MAGQLRYSDILAGILQKKNSRCVCPDYLSLSVGPKRPSTGPKRPSTGGSCHFGPNCQFTTSCEYNEAVCTCYGQCTCGPAAVKSCTCAGACYCVSEESLPLCTCTVCLCQPTQSPSYLLPSPFRNIVKAEASRLMSDDLIKRECDEIKQLLVQHEESKNMKPRSHDNGLDLKKSPSKKSLQISPKPTIVAQVEPPQLSPSHPASLESISKVTFKSLPPAPPLPRSVSIKRADKKSQRKEKSTKKRRMKPLSAPSTKTKFTSSYCGCRPLAKKPLRIRYYYSGSTENYGVKMGHKQCVRPPQQVPKTMGWLWNIEDPSKGIRERRGWPPGFIGKNIKNMMKVMMRSDQIMEVAGGEGQGETRRGWRPAEFVEDMRTPTEEPPLLHIHKKGRTYNITFCPKESDDDIGPVPIPFSITEKKHESGTDTSESTLEFELHSPKPRGPPKLIRKVITAPPPAESRPSLSTTSPSTKKHGKRKARATAKSRGSEEEQQSQMQHLA